MYVVRFLAVLFRAHSPLELEIQGITPTLLGIRVITGKSIDTYTKASRSLAFASGGAGDTTVSTEAGGFQPRQKSRGRLFEFASKEVTIIGRENTDSEV
jgi:hypothetical protein